MSGIQLEFKLLDTHRFSVLSLSLVCLIESAVVLYQLVEGRLSLSSLPENKAFRENHNATKCALGTQVLPLISCPWYSSW